MKLRLLKDVKVSGKTVFLRADLDVPVKSQMSTHSTSSGLMLSEVEASNVKSQMSIEDDTRLVASLPTIEYLLKHGAKVVIGGHLGRPIGFDKSLSLEPVAYWLQSHLEGSERSQGDFSSLSASRNDKNTTRETKIGDFDGWEITPKLFLLENLRFNGGEEENDKEFAKKLASLADIYVNDAFAMSHRNHASIVGITQYLPHFAGFHLEKEVEVLSKVMDNPKRPLVVIVGGKKIETKLPLVEKMHKIADYVLVGGKIAGESKAFLKVRHEKIIGRKSVLLVADLTPDGLSITEKSLYNFLDIIGLSKTIIWNGSMGFIDEREDEFHSTRKIAQAILKSNAYSVVGGGDTVEFLNRIKLLDKFSFVSTGGGAMLEYLSGGKLPGIEALN